MQLTVYPDQYRVLGSVTVGLESLKILLKLSINTSCDIIIETSPEDATLCVKFMSKHYPILPLNSVLRRAPKYFSNLVSAAALSEK
jgi:hypothetical protein